MSCASSTWLRALALSVLLAGSAPAGIVQVFTQEAEDFHYKSASETFFHFDGPSMGAALLGAGGKIVLEYRSSLHFDLSGFSGWDVLGDGALHLFIHDEESISGVAGVEIHTVRFDTPLAWWIDKSEGGDLDEESLPQVPAYADADETHHGEPIGSYTIDGTEEQGQEITIAGPKELYDSLMARRAILPAPEAVPVVIVPNLDVAWEHVVDAFNQAVRAKFKKIGFGGRT